MSQVFSQVSRTWDPAGQRWLPELSVFVQASSGDGLKVFDRWHLLHDGQSVSYTLTPADWTSVERNGETWLGANGIRFPEDEVLTGDWRIQLVTKDGQKAESVFRIPPAALDAPRPRTEPVVVTPLAAPGRYRVTGWVESYLLWTRDARGQILSRNKTVGPEFTVPGGVSSFFLYSYDKDRGEGLVAGPFGVQNAPAPADR